MECPHHNQDKVECQIKRWKLYTKSIGSITGGLLFSQPVDPLVRSLNRTPANGQRANGQTGRRDGVARRPVRSRPCGIGVDPI